MKFNRKSAWQRVWRASRRLALPILLAILGMWPGTIWAQSTGAFTATGDMTTARYEHTATLLLDGRVLIAGGNAGFSNSPLSSAELYDPSSRTFRPTGSLITARRYHRAMLLPNGTVLILGLTGINGGIANAEIYDPATETFTAAGDIAITRPGVLYTTSLLDSNTVMLSDGRIFRGYGPSYYGPFGSGVLYDPATDTFVTTGNMTPDGEGHTVTLLANGMVLLAGGVNRDVGTHFGNAGLYDPASDAFSQTASMSAIRYDHTATLLMDGRVLITGGSGNDCPRVGACYFRPNSRVSAELYDPATGAFSFAGNMVTGRTGNTTTLLLDGTVLITGGIELSGGSASSGAIPMVRILASAELYGSPISEAAPAPVSLLGDGRGQGAIQHADTYEVVSASSPAVAGEFLAVYCTGLIDGSVIPPQLTIGGRMAEVLFFGNVPGFAGLNQVNVRVPSGIAPGPAVSVRMTYLGRPSNEVTIAVR